MRCWAMKRCSHLKGSLCLHQGWDRLLRGLVWGSWREESEGHRPQWWLTFDTQSPALWSESHCIKLATYQVCGIISASTLSTISGGLGSYSCSSNVENFKHMQKLSKCWWVSMDTLQSVKGKSDFTDKGLNVSFFVCTEHTALSWQLVIFGRNNVCYVCLLSEKNYTMFSLNNHFDVLI